MERERFLLMWALLTICVGLLSLHVPESVSLYSVVPRQRSAKAEHGSVFIFHFLSQGLTSLRTCRQG